MRKDKMGVMAFYCLLLIGLAFSLPIVIKLDVALGIVDGPGRTMSGPGVALHNLC